MDVVHEVAVTRRAIGALEAFATPEDLARFRRTTGGVARLLGGRTLWQVNSTSEGGGVAELLHQVLGYFTEAGIDCRWIVVDGDPPFFRVTKRIHNRLHGAPGDGGGLGEAEREAYRTVIDREAAPLLELARPGDVAVLHDPQTAGLVPPLVAAGLHVVWVSHVGVDVADDLARSAWDFLRADVEPAGAYVFTRPAYAWDGLDAGRVRVIPPCIDPTSPKNAELDAASVSAIIASARILAIDGSDETRVDLPGIGPGIGPVVVRRPAELVEDEPAPAGCPVVVQISRWDRLKDHLGVLRGFAAHVDLRLGARLLLVGPSPATVADDPEGAEVFAEVVEAWEDLPAERRRRVHLVNLPVDDRVENAVVVNALQRRADVVVQKSLAEGFGLTVAEAMWKGRPVVGSRVGGIQDQLADGRSGILIDPADLAGLGRSISALISDLGFAQAIGHAARERVRSRYLPPHFVGAHLEVVRELLEGPS
jgi:trehalose synthase